MCGLRALNLYTERSSSTTLFVGHIFGSGWSVYWCVNNLDRLYFFARFYVIMCLTRVLKRWHIRQKMFFCQDVFNRHGFDCNRIYIRIFFLKIMITWELIWKALKTYNDIRFCKEAKTIIVVDVWLNSLSLSCVPWVSI